MKYYIYISDTKVDMLYPQIPKPLLKKIASNLSIDLKLLGAEVNIGAKSNPSDETRYAKVRIVSEYIEKHLDVGTVDAPSTYFKGQLSLRQGTFKDQVAYFGGETAQTVLGLCGSIKHVIGSNMGTEIHTFNSALYAFEIMIADVISEAKLVYNDTSAENKIDEEIEQDALIAIVYLTKNQKGHKQQFEFLAKTLLQGHSYTKHYVVFGTPIYVALTD
jgi:hypothetical protein